MAQLRIATLNIRNLADRWDERLPLLLADMAALQPDILGLQEVVYPMQQDRIIGAAGERRYVVFRGWARRPEYGNSLLLAEEIAAMAGDPQRLDLGHGRSALRLQVTLDDRSTGDVTVTHLHHVPADEGIRDEQAARLVDWLATGPPTDVQIVVGDFNAEPAEPAAARMRSHGYRSAMAEANGADPDVTWPSGLQAPAMDTDGDPGCLDYIWLRGDLRSRAARLAFDRPAVGDPSLYPSDHVGLVADMSLRWQGQIEVDDR